jgi:hypothetical protein
LNAPRQDPAASILKEGENCWCQEQASRFATLVDAADYFAAFAQACRNAERQIIILGWISIARSACTGMTTSTTSRMNSSLF